MLKVGQRVMCVRQDELISSRQPFACPNIGAIGTVVDHGSYDVYLVSWGADSGVAYNDRKSGYSWWCMGDILEVADD